MSSINKESGSSPSGFLKGTIATSDPVCAQQVKRWLRHGFTGCSFAQSLANSQMLFTAVDADVAPEHIDQLFDFAASEHVPAIVVFPSLRTESQLVELFGRLHDSPRWKLTRETVEGLDTDDVLVGMQWTTSTQLISQPMGFGPFPTMPVTRRVPYVCLATWPGAHENPHHRRFRPQLVDFLDSSGLERSLIPSATVRHASARREASV